MKQLFQARKTKDVADMTAELDVEVRVIFPCTVQAARAAPHGLTNWKTPIEAASRLEARSSKLKYTLYPSKAIFDISNFFP